MLLLLLVLVLGCGSACRAKTLQCRHFEQPQLYVNEAVDLTSVVNASDGSITCYEEHDYCYALWNASDLTQPAFIAQTCINLVQPECEQEQCAGELRDRGVVFCCCNTSFCNTNVTISTVHHFDEASDAKLTQSEERGSVVLLVVPLALSCVLFTLLVVMATLLLYRRRRRSSRHLKLAKSPLSAAGTDGGQRRQQEQEASGAPTDPAATLISADDLDIGDVIGRGRYGTVHRAQWHSVTVAVKVFPGWHRCHFVAERDTLLLLAAAQHSSLVQLLATAERSRPADPTDRQHMLVLSYADQGTVADYLREHVLSFGELYRMSYDCVAGLVHLHTSVLHPGVAKPALAHRDINSRNILVRGDGSCCICDFGFAMKLSSVGYYGGGSDGAGETTSLSDVGTLRYMAPEVLEGAVNLRDCGTTLKQVDVYSMALVLWELYSRCGDMYPSRASVPDYQLPYQAEVGCRPSFEQMQAVVARSRLRPRFPGSAPSGAGDGDGSSSSQLDPCDKSVTSGATQPAQWHLRETIEDSWDHDGEARLTAPCVLERLSELPSLWQRQKANDCGGAVVPGLARSESSDLVSEPTHDTLLLSSSEHHFNAVSNGAMVQCNLLASVGGGGGGPFSVAPDAGAGHCRDPTESEPLLAHTGAGDATVSVSSAASSSLSSSRPAKTLNTTPAGRH